MSMSDFSFMSMNSFELLGKQKNYTYLYGYSVYNQLHNKSHCCQCKQMHSNYIRITTALCHLMAVLVLRQHLKTSSSVSCIVTYSFDILIWF